MRCLLCGTSFFCVYCAVRASLVYCAVRASFVYCAVRASFVYCAVRASFCMLLLWGAQKVCKKSISHLKMLGTRRVTRRKYHNEDPQTLSATSCFGATAPQWGRASSLTAFLHHTQRRTTVGRTPLNSSQRPLPNNTNTHNRQTSIHPVGFEPTIPASERPQTYAFDRAATGTGKRHCIKFNAPRDLAPGIYAPLM